MVVTTNTLSRLVACLLCIQPLLYSYDSIAITVVSLAIYAAYIGTYIFKYKFQIHKTALSSFLAYIMMVSLVFDIFFESSAVTVNRTVSVIIYIMALIILSEDGNMSIVQNVYKKVAWFSVIFFILQFFSYHVFHKAIMFKLPFLKLKDNLEMAYAYLGLAASYHVLTPLMMGPFSEPSHYAAFTIPLLNYYLFSKEGSRKKNIIYAVVIAVSILFSNSGLGIVLVAMNVILYFYATTKDKRWIPITIGVAVLALFAVYHVMPSVQRVVGNLFTVGELNSSHSKADYRIYRGVEQFMKLPLLHKIIGIGLYNAESSSAMYGIVNSFDRASQAFEYFNGISQVLIYSGIIGCCMFATFLYKIYRSEKSNDYRALMILYMALIVGSANLFEGMGLLYLSLLMAPKPRSAIE